MRTIGTTALLAMLLAAGNVLGQEPPAEKRKIQEEGRQAETTAAREADPRPEPEKERTAEEKAEVLEKEAAAKDGKASPAPEEKITRAEAQAVDPEGKKPLDDALTCLARTIYWEAKGEGRDGMAAVANVVMNRLASDAFPKTVCAVVKQGVETKTCQFSWWCDGRPDDVEEEKRYDLAKEIARAALNNELSDRTGGALYFHHERVHPEWSEKYTRTVQIEEHLFYKPKGEANGKHGPNAEAR